MAHQGIRPPNDTPNFMHTAHKVSLTLDTAALAAAERQRELFAFVEAMDNLLAISASISEVGQQTRVTLLGQPEDVELMSIILKEAFSAFIGARRSSTH